MQRQQQFPNYPSTPPNCGFSDNVLFGEIRQRMDEIISLLKVNLVTSEGGPDTFWSTYLEEAAKHDSELMEKYKNDMDIVVFFAGLFSAVVASFLAAIQPSLSPNPSDTTNALLMILIHTINNSAFPDQPLGVPRWNGPGFTVVYSQILGYISLSLGLFAALGAVVGKQWLSHFGRHGAGTDEVRGRGRQQKLDGLKAWRFDVAMKVLPAILHVALALFAIALCINLWGINRAVALAFISTTATTGLVYTSLTVSSLCFPFCPYETPFSTVIRWMIVMAIETARKFAYYLESESTESGINPLIGLSPLLLLPVCGWGAVILTILVVALLAGVLLVTRVKLFRQESAIGGLESWARKLSGFKDWLRPAPQQYPEFRSIAWILETSYHHDVIMAAVERVPGVVSHTNGQGHNEGGGQKSFDFFPLTNHLYDLFVGSVSILYQRPSANQRNRATALGKALVGILSQNFKLVAPPRFWNQARERFEAFQGYNLEPEVAFLLQLMVALLPIQVQENTDHLLLETYKKTDQIPKQLLFWSLPFLQSSPRQRQNPYLIHLFFTLPPVLQSVCFSREQEWGPLEQSSYFRACQVYLKILCQQNGNNEPDLTETDHNQPLGSVVNAVVAEHPLQVGSVDWNVIDQILTNMYDADESLCLREDECLPKTLDQLSELLRLYSSRPDDIGASIHKLTFRIYSWVKKPPTEFLLRHLVDSAISLATTDLHPEEHISSNISQILPLLLDCLIDSKPTLKEERPMYILKILKASSVEVNRSVWQSDPVIKYLFDPSRLSHVHRISLEVLSDACNSLFRDEVLERLIHVPEFRNYILRAINSEEEPSPRNAGLQILDAALLSLLRNEPIRATWQNPLASAILLVNERMAPLSESQFRLIRIKCALCPDESGADLSAYWKIWTKGQTGVTELQAAQVVPVAQWVLIHCGQSSQPAWYTELQDDFEMILQVAWGGSLQPDSSVLLHELINCTDKWLRSGGHAKLGTATATAIHATSDQILQSVLEYNLVDGDASILERFSNRQWLPEKGTNTGIRMV